MAVHRHEVGLVSGEAVIGQHFTSSSLVEDRDLYAVAEGRLSIDEDGVYVADERPFADAIASDIVIDVLDTAVVAYLYIM